MLDIKNLKSLIKLMVDNDLTELDLQDPQGERVTLKRGRGEPTVHYVPAPGAAPHPAPAAPATAPGSPAGQTAAHEAPSGAAITSPMVGTFYAATSPEAKPLVSVGDRVGPDTVVCIIEAMKVFNEIKAETTGVITEVVAVNGRAVEFGQPLFRIKP
jgi:acetyl-CoA carboxylase biotin carboxyl carrier protein